MSSWTKKIGSPSKDLVIISQPDSNILDIPTYTIETNGTQLSDISPVFYKEGAGTIRVESIQLDMTRHVSYSLKLDKKHIRISSPITHIPLFGIIKSQPSTKLSKIPKVIIQTWDTAVDETSELGYPTRVLKAMNPEYTYIFFNADERRDFIEHNFNSDVLNAYDKIKPIALKCDLWRYCYLYINGGVYLDIKTFTNRPLYSILDKDYELLVAIEHGGKGLFNGVMAAPPKHKFIKMLIDESVKNINKEYYGESPLDITGPTMCRRIYNIYEGKDETDLVKADNPNYKYVELVANEIIKDLDKNNIAFHRVFSTYYAKYNKLNNPLRFWNAWDLHDIYN